MNHQNIPAANDSKRRKLLIGLGWLSVFSLFSFRSPGKKKKNVVNPPNTTKMLTQDGQLVEVDLSGISHTSSNSISEEELKNWIKR